MPHEYTADELQGLIAAWVRRKRFEAMLLSAALLRGAPAAPAAPPKSRDEVWAQLSQL